MGKTADGSVGGCSVLLTEMEASLISDRVFQSTEIHITHRCLDAPSRGISKQEQLTLRVCVRKIGEPSPMKHIIGCWLGHEASYLRSANISPV
jgi:hypothetical protein